MTEKVQEGNLITEAMGLLHNDSDPKKAVQQLRLAHGDLGQEEAEVIVQAAQEVNTAPEVKSIRRGVEFKKAGLYFLGALLAGAFPAFIAPALWGKDHEQSVWYIVAVGLECWLLAWSCRQSPGSCTHANESSPLKETPFAFRQNPLKIVSRVCLS